jgi:hypothetical protein
LVVVFVLIVSVLRMVMVTRTIGMI